MKRISNTQNMMETATGDSKKLLLRHISEKPGVRYRELLRLTGLCNGSLTYNLLALENLNQIRVDRSKMKMTRYYLFDIPKDDTSIIGNIRNKTQIIIFVLNHDLCTFSEIVEYAKKAPSTISWHLKKLKDAGIILVIQGEKHTLYRLTNREQIAEVMDRYQESFLDAVVENYKEIVEEL
jgi:predicted transcriptional regulator